MESNGRRYHELYVFQADALSCLRDGVGITDVWWKQRHPGSRIAPVVDKLRNAHGFTIDGEGTIASPYRMRCTFENPQRVAVTEQMKLAYYETEHWRDMSRQRKQLDGACILCGATEELQVHHICYELFNEHIDDLMTVCRHHHEKIHIHSRIKFPSGVSVADGILLGFDGQFPDWLMPTRGPGELFAIH